MNIIVQAIRLTLFHLLDTYRRGFLVFTLAPVIAAPAILTEFGQHVVEIQNGMFNSRAGALAFANSALRWQFGVIKLAGLMLLDSMLVGVIATLLGSAIYSCYGALNERLSSTSD